MFVVKSVFRATGGVIGENKFENFADANGFYEIVSEVLTWEVSFYFAEETV